MRSPEELLASALAVIEQAFTTPAVYHKRATKRRPPRTVHKFAALLAPLYSGGHDSFCACHVASKSKRFDGRVYHIKTGIGSKRTLEHVRSTCREQRWTLIELASKDTYEQFVRDRGFPGPGMHQWTYIRLKERCVRQIVKGHRVALITGCRSQESVRRMGHVEPLKIGEVQSRLGVEVVENKNRYWSAPCHDWSSEEQRLYMDANDLPENPVKIALGMSGECFCGAFASPGEYDRIRRHCPDVADEIDRLAVIAQSLGKHSVWGTRPHKEKGVQTVRSGELCSGCEYRAAAAGVEFAPIEHSQRCEH